jgi:hypothetical protein
MHDVHAGIMSYCTINSQRLPPFAFSDPLNTNLPLSGHWGGATQNADPAAFGRLGVQWVNLWVLVRDGLTPPGQLICPGAAPELAAGQGSYFPYTFRFSTYCLRMPTSADLFDAAPVTWGRYGMGIYAVAPGGQNSPVKLTDPFGARYYEQVPQVRLDRRYELVAGAACGDGQYDPLMDVLLADSFWQQRQTADPPRVCGLQSWPVEASWCHGARFNVLAGNGAVRTVTDDGTVRANTLAPGAALPADGAHFASYAERVWQFFDGRQ